MRPGAEGEAVLPGGRTVPGKIAYVSSVADETTRTFRVELEIANPGGVLAEGLTSDLRIPTGSMRAHMISLSLLSLADDGRVGVKAVDDGNIVRFLPVAMALLWPVVRLVPRELIESARLDGAGPVRELVWVGGPYVRVAALRAAVAVTILALGELSAGKLVSTPGAESYAEVVWAQLHYGVSGDLAARCLLLLAAALAGVAVLGALSRRRG